MRPILIFILMLGSLMQTGSLSAQAQLVLENVDASIAYALQNNLQLKSVQHTADAAAQAKPMQRAALMPQLKAVSTLDYYFSLPVQLIPAEVLGGEPGTYLEVSFGQPYALNLGVEASMPLINASLWTGTQQAAMEAKTAALQLEHSRLNTAESVARAYYLTLLSQQAVALALNTKAANDSLMVQAGHKLQNGILEPLEANRIRNLQLESNRNLEENRAVFANNLSRLKVLLGLAPGEELLLTEEPGGEIRTLQAPAYSYTALPVYRLGEARVQSSKLNWQRERRKLLPELSAYARYTRQAQRDAFNFTESGQPWFNIGIAGLRLDWPLFTGFHRLASTRKAHLQWEAATLELQHTANQLQQEQQELLTNYQQSSRSLAFAQESFALGNQNYQLARLKYNAGVLPLDGLINVYHEKLRAQNSLLKALSDHLYYSALITTRNTY
ncbi:TolC family protein [Cesiribacter sp. SM1]|uniref:TolC family protein n=1 Tax=Cesiribacter sp. SM1 TaxID=2861196 RepID=UPI001CD2F9F1|nr:TolC family protein [Cesiribacter sp. SM1]